MCMCQLHVAYAACVYHQLQLLALRIDAAATAPRVEWQCRAHLSCAVLPATASFASADLLPALSLTNESPHASFSLSLACTPRAVQPTGHLRMPIYSKYWLMS